MTQTVEAVVKMRRKTLNGQAPMPLLFSIDVNPNDSITLNLPVSVSCVPEEAPPIVAAVPVSPPPVVLTITEPVEPVPAPCETLAAMYQRLLGPKDREKRIRPATIRGNLSSLRRFEAWASGTEQFRPFRGVALLEAPNILFEFAQYLRAQDRGSSASMCMKAIAAIIKLAGACVKLDLIRRKPSAPSRSEINILKPRSERQRRVKGVPVSVDELRAMLAVVDRCVWPRLGNVSPATFWKTSLLAHFVYGFRTQDWFAFTGPDKPGLLWSGVITDSQCPQIEDLHNPAGWIWYLVNKTKNKDEAAERPSDVLVPLSWTMRNLIEQFRDVDPVRVFPLRNNSASYSKQFRLIREWAGLSDAAREQANRPIIRLSLGQRNVASCRKSSAALWAKHVGRCASSYMLHHAVQEEGVSKMTTENYLQHEQVLRDITAVIENLPVWSMV